MVVLLQMILYCIFLAIYVNKLHDIIYVVKNYAREGMGKKDTTAYVFITITIWGGIKMAKLQRAFLSLLGIVMVCLLTLDGLGRYILGKSISWAEELTRIMFVWGCFVSITVAFIKRAHIGFDVLAKKNDLTKKVSAVINGICLALVGIVVMYYGWMFTMKVGKFPLPATGVPISILYIAGVIAGVAWIVIGLYQSFNAIRS